ncbi:MAG: hypothetical protein AB9869_27700 [Verrucomicrobiia bacterium]
MRTKSLLFFALPLLFVVERGAHADPVDPLPFYYVTETAGRVITDVPGAIVIQLSQNNWRVQLPPGQFWVIPNRPRLNLANPDSPQTFNLVSCAPAMPGWDASGLFWMAHTKIEPWDFPIVPSGYASIHAAGDELAWVLLKDLPDAVPDQSSSLSLLAAALLGTGGLARLRRFSLR